MDKRVQDFTVRSWFHNKSYDPLEQHEGSFEAFFSYGAGQARLYWYITESVEC